MSESPDAPLHRRPPADTTLLLQTPVAGVAHYDFADTDLPLEGGILLELARKRTIPTRSGPSPCGPTRATSSATSPAATR